MYTSEEMLKDVYSMNRAFHKKTSGGQILLENEQTMADRYEKLFQNN